jgi:multidrug efflux pump subunit AcrB
LLLLGVLLAEFNSFRNVAIIMITVPLAAAGVIPGLLIGGQPFGFMSLLGVIALVGIVVNNAIVLLEVVESRREAGADIPEALQDAVSRRIRPILLTTATTVAGLLPLALSKSTLWPPLASAMISGLISSTLLTLVVVPALYRALMRPMRLRMPKWTGWPGKRLRSVQK